MHHQLERQAERLQADQRRQRNRVREPASDRPEADGERQREHRENQDRHRRRHDVEPGETSGPGGCGGHREPAGDCRPGQDDPPLRPPLIDSERDDGHRHREPADAGGRDRIAGGR